MTDMTNMKKFSLVGLAILAVAAIFTYFAWPDNIASLGKHDENAHSEGEKESKPESLLLTAKQIRANNIFVGSPEAAGNTEILVPGTVTASPTGIARLDASANGVVRRIFRHLGDPVRRGETIATIESGEAAGLTSDIASARARLNQARANYQREKRLFDANVTARQDMETARTNLSLAEADMARAARVARAAGVGGNGSTIAIRSPINGRITSAPAVLGSYVSAGTEMFSVVDPAQIQLEAALRSEDVGRIAIADSATVELPNGEQLEAVVHSISPSLDRQTRAATAILDPVGPVVGLQADSFVQIRISGTTDLSSDGDTNNLSIPAEAVQKIDGEEIVFVRTKEGFRPVNVTVGTQSGGRIVVLSGIKKEDKIATKKAFLLKAQLEKAGASHDH